MDRVTEAWNHQRARRAASAWACVALCVASAPGIARADAPTSRLAPALSALDEAATPDASRDAADKRPYVPRYQGPYNSLEPSASDWELLWGFSLLGTGALLGGLGFYALETHNDVCDSADGSCGSGRGRIGGALLLSGVLLSGVGVYLVAISQPMAPRTILLEPLASPGSSLELDVDVELRDGGGVLWSGFSF